MYIKRNRFTC